MSLIDLQTARDHLRVDPDYPDSQVALYLGSAERIAAEFLNRRIFETTEDLADAVAAVPASLTAASAAYDAAIETASEIEDAYVSTAATEYAERVFATAKAEASETYSGIVVNDSIRTAILLTMTAMHENRGDDPTQGVLSPGAIQLLFPFRVGLGV